MEVTGGHRSILTCQAKIHHDTFGNQIIPAPVMCGWKSKVDERVTRAGGGWGGGGGRSSSRKKHTVGCYRRKACLHASTECPSGLRSQQGLDTRLTSSSTAAHRLEMGSEAWSFVCPARNVSLRLCNRQIARIRAGESRERAKVLGRNIGLPPSRGPQAVVLKSTIS
eukprot:SAG31_NODE_5353_length_2592_cov_2.383129_2_plen_167_part_00